MLRPSDRLERGSVSWLCVVIDIGTNSAKLLVAEVGRGYETIESASS
jgi:exopolyphosphatase/pppGpp-phosphohydrolase